MRIPIALLALSAASALYSKKDQVVELTKENWDGEVMKSDGVYLVEFYAPWCGHCKNLAPEWIKLASALKGIADVGAVDMTVHESLGQPYSVTGFPTILIFGADKKKPTPYEGERSAKALANAAIGEAKNIIRARLGLKKAGGPKKESAVVTLTQANFDDTVFGGDAAWMVEFFAPWCGHCKNLAPEWEKAAQKLKAEGKENVKLAAVDATKENALAQKYQIQGYPTIKVFEASKTQPSDYQGGRSADAIYRYALGLIGEGPKPEQPKEEPKDDTPTKVVDLTDANWEDTIAKSKDLWFVEFFAPWCGHCKNLAPHWKAAAAQLEGKVTLAQVDATANPKLGEKYKIQSYPTIKMFLSDKETPLDYEGGRTTETIIQYAEQIYAENLNPPQVTELTSQAVWTEQCGGKQLCVVSFLPNILDSGLSGRKQYLEDLQAVADKFKRNRWAWLWVEAGAQMALEEKLDVGGSGYPALRALAPEKNRYVQFAGRFDEEKISVYMRKVTLGREPTIPYKMPAIATINAWDGTGPEVQAEAPKDEL